MTNSTPVLGTNTKNKMTWSKYIFTHLIPTWFQSFNYNFVMWRDLVTGNYSKYALLKNDDPFQECYDYFWCSINLDETYPKEFLEYLMQMVEDIDSGKVSTHSLTTWEDFMKELKEEEE